MHKVKVIYRKECGNCQAIMPELDKLSEEVPIEFIDADSSNGRREISKISLPIVVFPLINIDNRIVLMGYHSNIRTKVLKSLLKSPGISNVGLERVIIENYLEPSKDFTCSQDIEFDLKTGEVLKKRPRCKLRG